MFPIRAQWPHPIAFIDQHLQPSDVFVNTPIMQITESRLRDTQRFPQHLRGVIHVQCCHFGGFPSS
jgi:hypothetical protein